MNDASYKKIEAQALGILDTLTALKREIEGYGKARTATEESLATLGDLADQVAGAAQALRDTSVTLGESDYASILGAIDTHAAEFSNELGQRLSDQQPSDALLERFEQLDASIHAIEDRVQSLEQLQERIEAVDAKLDRLEDALQGGRGGTSEEFALLSGKIVRLSRSIQQSHDDMLRFNQESQQRLCDLDGVVEDLKVQTDATNQAMRSFVDAAKADDATMLHKISAISENAARASESNANLKAQLYELKDVIARVDRNTQKGFGKERG